MKPGSFFNASRVDFVSDRYKAVSIKNAERSRKAGGHTIVYRELSMHARKLHISSENICCLARTRNLFACSLFVTGKRFRLKNVVEGPCVQLTATPVACCQLTPTTPSTQKTLQNSSVIMKRRTPDFYYTQKTLLLNAPVLSSKVLTLMCSSYVLPM